MKTLTAISIILINLQCDSSQNQVTDFSLSDVLLTGAERTDEYLPLLEGKSIGLIVNHTSLVNGVHLVDTLLSLGIRIKKIFAPEHGFRGTADAGELVSSAIDQKTGIPIFSLYGNTRKPPQKELEGIDLMIFDIQDVGARFYTYISTMSYAMDACAEETIPFMVLDRPNPNGHYVDGPVMYKEFTSFIGLHEVPIVHGMTVAEYAWMVNEEGWLGNGRKCHLTTIVCKGYSHTTFYSLPVKPSPNLPNMQSIYLYPSICLFEATAFSVGRGTDKQFQLIGHPDFEAGGYQFTPVDKPGAQNPKHENKLCQGIDLSVIPIDSLQRMGRINLIWLHEAYQQFGDKDNFFENHFYKLAGNKELEAQIREGIHEDLIQLTWQEGLDKFKTIRKKYLLYPDFE